MKNKSKFVPVSNEQGFVLIAAMMLMVVLIFIGASTIDNTTIELKISGNDRVAKDNFHRAEGASAEAAQKVFDEEDLDELLPNQGYQTSEFEDLIKDNSAGDTQDDVAVLDENGDNKIDKDDLTEESDIKNSLASGELKQVVTLNRIETGNSLVIGGPSGVRRYNYTAYGLSEAEQGKALIKMGFIVER